MHTLKQDNERLQRQKEHHSAVSSPHHKFGQKMLTKWIDNPKQDNVPKNPFRMTQQLD